MSNDRIMESLSQDDQSRNALIPSLQRRRMGRKKTKQKCLRKCVEGCDTAEPALPRKYYSRRNNILRLVLPKIDSLVQRLAERELCTMATLLLHLVNAAVGLVNTTLSLMSNEEEDEIVDVSVTMVTDLVVCLPKNATTCVLYVNTDVNGLIELNKSVYPALKVFKDSYDYRIIARINSFWLKFEPPSDMYYDVMTALYMTIFFVGTTGNGLVIYMFARCKALRTSPYMLVLNLAISDFMIVFKCPLAAYNNYMRGPELGDWGCRIYGFIGGFSGTASIGMLTIIAMDRYNVVVNPLNPNRINYSTKYYICYIAFVWFYAFLFSSMPFVEIGLSRYVPEGYFTTCSFDYLDTSLRARIFMFIFFICAWLVPLSIICYCYFHIMSVVFRTHKTLQSNKNKQKIEIRLAIIVLLVILLWFVAWTPYSIVAICGIFGQEQYLTPSRAMIPAIFCKTASCLNPFLYTISHKRFRSELMRLFCKRAPLLHYSTTRSSYMTKSSRRQHQVSQIQRDTAASGMRSRDGIAGGSLYHQRQHVFKRNARSSSMPEGVISVKRESTKLTRPMVRSSIVTEDNVGKFHRSSSSKRSIIAGQDGSKIFVIDAAEPEEDVIFIVSGRSSALRDSVSTQVIILNSDNNGRACDDGPAKTDMLETSF